VGYLSTSPPLSPSPSKERGILVRSERLRLSLTLLPLEGNSEEVLEGQHPSKGIVFPFHLLRGRG